MMTVRFPNGQAIQYNRATYVNRSERYSDLYTAKDGAWIAQVPNTCIVEVEPACRVYNPLDKINDTETAKEIRSIKRKIKSGK